MKIINLFTSILLLTGFAQATEVRKIFDGTQAYCSEPADSKYTDQDIVISARVENNELILQAVTCVHSKWVPALNLTNRQFTTFEGLKVIENYFSFKLSVQTSDWSKSQIINLSNFANLSLVRISLNELKAINAKSVDINVSSRRLTNVSNGYSDTDDVIWGSARVFLSK